MRNFIFERSRQIAMLVSTSNYLWVFFTALVQSKIDPVKIRLASHIEATTVASFNFQSLFIFASKYVEMCVEQYVDSKSNKFV